MKVTKYRVNGKGSYVTLEDAAAAANRIFQRRGVIVEVTAYQGRMDRTEWLLRPIETVLQAKHFREQRK